MRLTIQIIVLIGLCSSCKENKKEQKSFEYSFGLENKVIVDSNLMISDTGIFIHERIDGNEIDTTYFANKDYWFSPCFLDNDTLKIIKTSGLSNYRFLIFDSTFSISSKERESDIEYVFKSKLKNKKILKQRLIINKLKLLIDDTLKLKYYCELKYQFYTRNDTILKDSICIEYIINKKTKELLRDFESIEFTYLNPNLQLFGLLKSNLFDTNFITDTSLYIPESITINNERIGKKTIFTLHYNNPYWCFLKDNSIYIKLNNSFYNLDYDNFRLKKENNTNNIEYTFDSIGFHEQGNCVRFNEEFSMFKYKVILNKNSYKINDTLKCKAYFLAVTTEKAGMFTYYLDSISAQFKLYQYNKDIEQYLSKFPK